jgi:ribosomal protein S8E
MPVDTIIYNESGLAQTAPTSLAYSVNQKLLAPLNNPGAVSTTAQQPFTLNVNVIAGGTQPAAVLSLPPGIWAGGRPFEVRAWGTITTGASTNITMYLYQVPYSILTAGTASTLANDNLVTTSAVVAVNTATTQFYLKARFAWDPTSATLNGVVYEFTIGASLSNSGALTATTAVTGLNAPVTSVPNADGSLNLSFLLALKASAANASTVINLNWFEAVGV